MITKMRILFSFFAFLCMMAPASSLAKEMPPWLQGKTIEFKGKGTGCLAKYKSNCMQELKAVHKIYFSRDGNIFLFFDDKKSNGIIVKRGKSRAKSNIPLNGNITTQTGSIKFVKNKIVYDYKISEKSIYTLEYRAIIYVSNNKCTLMSYHQRGRVIAGNMIFNSSPIYCRIRSGR